MTQREPFGPATAYLQLIRLPATFSAWSNILAAHLIATGGHPTWHLLWLQLGITTTLYWAGMVLNDCFDSAEDSRDRPRRPLPSGRVSLARAWGIGLGLLGAGLLLGIAAGGATLACTLSLAAAILLYNGRLKRGPVGPAVMGLCRSLNWLIGLAAAPLSAAAASLTLPIFLYTAGVTVLSGIEVRGGNRRQVLAAAALLLAAGLAISGLHVAGIQSWPPALAALALFIALLGARLLYTARRPDPDRVRVSVGGMLVGMIPLDAIVLSGDGQWQAALGLLLLLIPARLLARRLYLT
jgi:4-hydroxybenzoate polyprenyltransferase